MDRRGTVSVVETSDVLVGAERAAEGVVEHMLGVPAVEPPFTGRIVAVVGGVPVLGRPVEIAPVEIGEHVVDEIVDIQHLLDGRVIGGNAQVGLHAVAHGGEVGGGGGAAAGRGADGVGDNIPVGFLAAIIG